MKDQVQVFATQAVVFDQNVASCRAVQPDVLHFDACFLQAAADSLDNVLQGYLQGGKVASSMDGDNFSQDLMQPANLIPVEHTEGHAVLGATLLCHLE